jgi:Protein of unknown function (DUF429)
MLEAHSGIFLGFDPGGDNKFGVALLDGICMKTTTVGTVDSAMKWVVKACGGLKPTAAGIDTLLHWSTGKSGIRPCDERLRASYRKAKKSVMAPNSFFGAMAIGGMALALKLRQEWPDILLNETHPKVLLHALGKQYDPKKKESVETAIRLFEHQESYAEMGIVGEHAFDAALSAWATRKAIAERWSDIIGIGDNLIFPAGKVQYLWHEALST